MTSDKRLTPKGAAKRLVESLVGPSQFEETDICFRLARSGPPVMIDVGAHHGTSLRRFALDGWEVHAFEPDPSNRIKLLDAVAPLRRVFVSEKAISEVDGQQLTLYTSEISTGISTLTPFHASHTPTAVVDTIRLDTYINEVDIADVGFFKIDAEGHDLEILGTFPWDRIHPSVVLCEFEDRKTIPLGHTYHALAELLHREGYVVLVSEWCPIVEYGTAHRWKRAVLYPVDLDVGAWGNLIAIDSGAVEKALRLMNRSRARLRVRQLLDRVLSVAR